MKYQGTKLTNFQPIEKVEELQINDIEVGTGKTVQKTSTVTVHYTGALCKNGIIFQSSHDFGREISFPLNGVIEGWTKGMPEMKVGGMRRLIIPAHQAYGNSSPSKDIPANSDLVFDIELLDVK